MNVRAELRLDKDAFFSWLETQDRRHELVNGRPVMLPYVSRNHAYICTNILVALHRRMNLARHAAVQGDFAVDVGPDSVRFADIMVEKRENDGAARSTQNALFLAEVLSPSTMHVDFGDKLGEYLALPSLGTYLICAQDARRVWVWTRENGEWPSEPAIVEEAHAEIAIPVLGVTLPMAEIFRGMPFA